MFVPLILCDRKNIKSTREYIYKNRDLMILIAFSGYLSVPFISMYFSISRIIFAVGCFSVFSPPVPFYFHFRLISKENLKI